MQPHPSKAIKTPTTGRPSMSRDTKDIGKLETLLRLAKDRLAAAESGLFSPSTPLIDRYRTDVARI
jgi:hypothetical protein